MIEVVWASLSADVGRRMFCEAMRNARRTAIIEAQRFRSPDFWGWARHDERCCIIDPMETDPA